MRKKLTTKYIDALRPAEDKRNEISDTIVPGLRLRNYPTGRRVFCVSTRVRFRMRRITIGPYPLISLADARERARSILHDVALGKFEETQQSQTLGETIPLFIELYAKPRNRDWKGTERILKKFASLNSLALDQIRRSDVVRVLDQIIANGTSTRANRALAALKKTMSWSVDRGYIEISPIANLKPPTKEVARERVLTDDELASCWKAAEKEDFPFAQFTKLLSLTGQRRGEVAGMRWSEIDFEAATWTIPAERAKNATTHIVPLAPLAILILKSVPRFLGSDIVFTTNGATPISGFGRLKRRLDVAVGIGWRFHDIRRTVATSMAMMGIQPHIIEAVLNHKSGIVSGVAAVYNRHAYTDEKREALERWANRVSDLVAGVDTENDRDHREVLRFS